MALRDKMAASAAPFLQPGEPVQAVFAGQTASQENIRVHRRFFRDIESAGATAAAV
jgi:hypothetical protein